MSRGWKKFMREGGSYKEFDMLLKHDRFWRNIRWNLTIGLMLLEMVGAAGLCIVQLLAN